MPSLNGRQVFVVWLVALIATSMLLYAPAGKPAEYGHLYPTGYKWLLSIERPEVLDYKRLTVQYIIVGIVGFALGASCRGERKASRSSWRLPVGIACILAALGVTVLASVTEPIVSSEGFVGFVANEHVPTNLEAGYKQSAEIAVAESLALGVFLIAGAVLLWLHFSDRGEARRAC